MKSVRILLVDDEPGFAEPLALRLEKRDFEVTTAISGDEALERVDEAEFDVTLLDIFMPGRDGLETLREIKRRKPLTEVILLSGRGTKDIAIEGMQCGAYDFLTKPLEFAELIEKINDAHTRKVEHLARIRRAAEEDEGGRMAVEDAIRRETSDAAREAADRRKLIVLGQQTGFSKELVDYAVDMAARLSYDIIALNAAGFSKETFRSFPGARDKVCQDFRVVSEENVMPFREIAANKGIPFSHVVEFVDADEAIAEIKNRVGDIDYVICESDAGSREPGDRGTIVAYTPV